MSSGGPYKIGQQFGPYVLEEYLGAGAFKSVYRAWRETTVPGEEVVAVGFPHRQDEEGIAELEKEFAALSLLVHPNILRVHQLERYDGVTFIVMEFVEGRSLRKLLREQKCLPTDVALRYVGLLCEALALAHAARVLHRDVKPENVLIAPGNVPKLLDFGVARILTTSQQHASTNIGTVEYMAPEQMQGAAGTNADLWALGVTFFELLVGVRPFRGEMGEIYHQIMTGKYDERPLFDAGIDIRIIRILRKMLRKDPETRYQTAEELLSDLEAVARRTRLVDDDESRLEILIRASVPLSRPGTAEEVANAILWLLSGEAFDTVGIHGAVESDFFDWIVADAEGEALVRRIMAHVRR